MPLRLGHNIINIPYSENDFFHVLKKLYNQLGRIVNLSGVFHDIPSTDWVRKGTGLFLLQFEAKTLIRSTIFELQRDRDFRDKPGIVFMP